MEKRLPFQSEELNFSVFGEGSIPLLAIPGFGMEGAIYERLATAFGERYQVWAMDPPYHGRTSWYPKQGKLAGHGSVLPAEIAEIARLLLAETGAERLAVAGYSMGGRYAMGYASHDASLLEALYLLAPEGARPSLPYRFAVHTAPGRWLLDRAIKDPSFILGLLKFAETVGLVSEKRAIFVRKNVADANVRELVQQSWMAIRLLRPDMAAFQRSMQQYKVPLRIYFGKRDPVLPWKQVHRIAGDLKDVEIRILEQKGHFLFDEEVASLLREDVMQLAKGK